MSLRVGVLVSGNGGNLQALLDQQQERGYVVVVVVCNVAGAFAISRAEKAGVAVVVEGHKGLSREEHEMRVQQHLEEHKVELVVLAGYMRVLSSWLVARWPRKIVNVHPALLPAFPGMHGAKQALDHGCRLAGCTVHLVDDGVDSGPILLQAAVPVLDDDDEASLQARIQTEEHKLLPQAVEAFAAGRVVEIEGKVRVRSH
jgi:phosphoribosylglycinamide formyltransferase-1